MNDTLIQEPIADTIIIDPALTFVEKAQKINEKLSVDWKIATTEPSFIPDRFEFTFRNAKNYSNGEKQFSLFFIEYSDSSSLGNVLSNWYSCFGAGCAALKEKENTKIKTDKASYTIIGKYFIVHLEYGCPVELKTLLDEIKILFSKNSIQEITVDCRGSLRWKK
jgi:hypothetical protein